MDFGDKNINEENFEAVFNHWQNILGKYIVNGYKDSFYFLSNIQKDKQSLIEKTVVLFSHLKIKIPNSKVLMKDYDYFGECKGLCY